MFSTTVERATWAGRGWSGLPSGSPSSNTAGISTLPARRMLSARRASASSVRSASSISSATAGEGSAWVAMASLMRRMKPRPRSVCGSKKKVVLTMVLALASASLSISWACTSRGQGQRPMLAMLRSSIEMMAMRSDGARAAAVLPIS